MKDYNDTPINFDNCFKNWNDVVCEEGDKCKYSVKFSLPEEYYSCQFPYLHPDMPHSAENRIKDRLIKNFLEESGLMESIGELYYDIMVEAVKGMKNDDMALRDIIRKNCDKFFTYPMPTNHFITYACEKFSEREPFKQEDIKL